MSSAAAEPLRYAWPPLPVLDTVEASNLMAERIGYAFDDLEAQRLRVLNSTWLGRKAEVNATIKEFQAGIAGFLDTVDADTRKFIELHLGPAYQDAVTAATSRPMEWTAAHTTALRSLASDTYADFLARARAAGKVSDSFVRAVRNASAAELPKIAAGGRTAIQAADRLEERLRSRYDVSTITYRDGSRVTARTYARMAARTKSAVAYNAGTLNGCQEAGVGWVEVFDGSDCGWENHDDTDKANGSIRTVAEAMGFPVAHPNCLRSYGARPDVRSAKDAKNAKPSTTSEQRADQAAAERARQPTRAAQARRTRNQLRRDARRAGLSVADPAVLQRGLLLDDAGRASRDLRATASAVEKQLTPQLQAIVVDRAGGQLAGLEFRLKGESSLTDKLTARATNDYAGDVAAAADSLADVVRYTAVLDEAGYATQAQFILDELRDAGYSIKMVKNYWSHPTNPYRGINVGGLDANGFPFELQFHTPLSLQVKEGQMHKLYEAYRYETNPAVRAQLEADMWKVSKIVTEPPGAAGFTGERVAAKTVGYRPAATTDMTKLDLATLPDPSQVASSAFAASGESDVVLQELMRRQGFGAPTRVTAAEYDDLVGSGWEPTYRGFGNVSQEARVADFMGDDPWVGTGAYGNGWYFSDQASTASSYGGGEYISAALNPAARVIDYEDVRDATRLSNLFELGRAGWSDRDLTVIENMGRWATANGYDAIRVPAGGGETYLVILNRSALAVRG